MELPKDDLTALPTRALLAYRRQLAAGLGEAEHVLAGTLTQQARRCGKPSCACADTAGHGPYTYFSPRRIERGRLRYVPAGLVAVVRGYLARGGQAEAALAGICAVNAELLARRELT
jgi:hypothetical protein